MNKDQAYGAIVLVVSAAIAVLYVMPLFPSFFGLPTWLKWWAIALPVILAVLAVLTICAWIGWVMLTTPPPPPLEELTSEPAEPSIREDKNKT